VPQGIPRPEHLVTGPLHDLVHALHDLYDAAGRPSTRLVSSAVRKRSDLRDTVSHETVSAMLKGSGVPKWVKLECVVIFLAGIAVDQPDRITTVRHFRDLWLAASRSTNSPYDQGGISIDSAGQIIRKTNPEPAEPPIRSALGTESSSEIPPRNPYFTGRSRVLRRINDFFDRGELLTTVIGMGGTGKTQLAIEYLHRYRDSYDLIWWANSETSSRLRASLSALGTILSLPASTPMHHPPTQVLAALSRSNLRWLLVLDNAIAPGDLPEFESSGSGHVLVTSRDPGWIHQGSVVELDVFERSESVELLRSSLVGGL